MKKKILFYQWKSAFHAHLEQVKELIPESAKSVMETIISDLHTQIDSIGVDEVDETFLDSIFTPKTK